MGWLVEVPFGTDLTAAWFAIGGVVLGAISTGGISYLAERRQERREYELALKLAKAEIDEILKLVRKALDEEKWPLGMATKNWAQSWSTNRRSLASRMDRETFAAVAAAYGFAEQIQSGLAVGDKEFKPPPSGEGQGPDEVFFSDVETAFALAADKVGA